MPIFVIGTCLPLIVMPLFVIRGWLYLFAIWTGFLFIGTGLPLVCNRDWPASICNRNWPASNYNFSVCRMEWIVITSL